MVILNVRENKDLIITKYGSFFEDENNAETIKINLPKFINGHDVANCITTLNFLNQENKGDIIDISSNLIPLDAFGGYYCEINVSNKITYLPGLVQIWFEFLSPADNLYAKTNIVKHRVESHLNADDNIPEQTLTILQDIQLKLNKLMTDVDAINEQILDLQNGTIFMVMPEPQDDSDNDLE